jgi:hypothetical protein
VLEHQLEYHKFKDSKQDRGNFLSIQEYKPHHDHYKGRRLILPNLQELDFHYHYSVFYHF